MIPDIWYRWLGAAIIGLMVLGISMILAPGAIKQLFSALLYSAPDAIDARLGEAANDYIVLVHGILGAVMFGWAVAMWLALRGPFRRGEREGWLLIAVPVAAWYVPDTLFSLHTGFWPNAVLNTLLAVLFAIPLAASRKYCQKSADQGR